MKAKLKSTEAKLKSSEVEKLKSAFRPFNRRSKNLSTIQPFNLSTGEAQPSTRAPREGGEA